MYPLGYYKHQSEQSVGRTTLHQTLCETRCRRVSCFIWFFVMAVRADESRFIWSFVIAVNEDGLCSTCGRSRTCVYVKSSQTPGRLLPLVSSTCCSKQFTAAFHREQETTSLKETRCIKRSQIQIFYHHETIPQNPENEEHTIRVIELRR